MRTKRVVSFTNGVALVSVGLLGYWVFIFVSITVFELKVFRENITQAFYLSIIGILSLLTASIILNVMLNMTRIADHFNPESRPVSPQSKPFRLSALIFILTFPLTFAMLVFGDIRSSAQKREYLIQSGQSVIEEQSDLIQSFADYEFSESYITQTAENLKILSRIDENFPNASVIIQDKINGKPILLQFTQNNWSNPNEKPFKTNFIFSTSSNERTYLNSVFREQMTDSKFSANDGNYELYFPVQTSNRIIVLYLSDRSRYGKVGS